MVTEHLTAVDLIAPAIADQWPDAIPTCTMVLMTGIRPDGAHGLHAVHNTDAPIWVLIGMLRCVLTDLEHRWADAEWVEDDSEDDDGFDE